MRRILLMSAICGLLAACSSVPEKSMEAPIEDSSTRVTAMPSSGSDTESGTAGKTSQTVGKIVEAGGVLPSSAASSLVNSTTTSGKEADRQRAEDMRDTANESNEQRQQRIAKVLASKSIFFDYDDYSIKTEYQSVIEQDAHFISSTPNLMVRIEGNADERGSTEYNLALGQKRAEAVRQALQLYGVPDASVEAISYGKEKPRAECHEESCWAENRRVDFTARYSGDGK